MKKILKNNNINLDTKMIDNSKDINIKNNLEKNINEENNIKIINEENNNKILNSNNNKEIKRI